ncbi:MAG: hypothetical protein A2078_14155 [Nitrospirae bacterium GWC2_57_9]|nr:MAG: hypothetical protein A2078_14155 [Nitrospirae bacterium GWC2_57_9]
MNAEEDGMQNLLVKYVMIDYVIPILFFGVDHKAMRAAGNITSAGFIAEESGKLKTGGESFSLGMKPAVEDADIIEWFMVKGGLR